MEPELQLKLYNQIERYLKKLKVQDEILEDIRSDVFLKAHQSIDKLKDKEKLTSWLNVITFNAIKDYYRAKQNLSEGLSEHFVVEEQNINEEGNEDLLKCIELIIMTLSKEQQEVMMEVEINGASQTDYAYKNNIPLSTVKSRVQRARQSIKTTVKQSCILATDHEGNVLDYVKPKNMIN